MMNTSIFSFDNCSFDTLPRLHSVRQGGGDHPVLLVHGWSCQASDWQQTLARLSLERPLIAPDLPGHGGSRALAWSDWTIRGMAQALVAFARGEGVQRLALVGHSMGGVVALEAASLWQQAGGELEQVILVDTFGLPYGDMDAETIAAIEAPFHRDFAGAMRNLVTATTVPALDPETRAWIAERMAGADPERMLPLWGDLLRWSPDEVLATLRCPIHALNGEHIPELARRRCAARVHAQVIPDSHHFPQFEQPEVFYRCLRALLC